MSEWQPIETAPKDGTFFLVSDEKHLGIGAYFKHVEPETCFDFSTTPWKKIPNPEAGRIYEGVCGHAFWTSECGAFPLDDLENPLSFEPTRWMPFPKMSEHPDTHTDT